MRRGGRLLARVASARARAPLREVPFALFWRPRVLIVGVGGGLDIAVAARHAGAIDGVEADAGAMSVMSGRKCSLYRRASVYCRQGREFLEEGARRYDLIMLPWPDQRLSPQVESTKHSLFTLEGLSACLRGLRPEGALFVAHYEDWIPGIFAALKLLAGGGPGFVGRAFVYRKAREGAFLIYRPGGLEARDAETLAAQVESAGGELLLRPDGRAAGVYADLSAASGRQELDAILRAARCRWSALTDLELAAACAFRDFVSSVHEDAVPRRTASRSRRAQAARP